MNWIKINFCETLNCQKNEHIVLDKQLICDSQSLPSKSGNYLVSDEKEIEISEFALTFNNWDCRYNRKVKNKDIKYWLDLKDISLPKRNQNEMDIS